MKQHAQAERDEPPRASPNVRVREVKQSPDRYIYIATEQPIRGDAVVHL